MTDLPLAVADWSAPAMGGRLSVAVAAEPDASTRAASAARQVGRRVTAWASRLTRFDGSSDLSRLNADGSRRRRVRPTLGSVLYWAREASAATDGVVDVTLLDERLAAEFGASSVDAGARPAPAGDRPTQGSWAIRSVGREVEVAAAPGLRFDLDGVAKGWLADRANDLLADWPGAFVDADGDVALSATRDVEWLIDVVNPAESDGSPIATLRFAGTSGWRRTCGIATSGTSVHRWRSSDGRVTHHLIDPRSGLPAVTDVVQATVIAPTAREAEVMAKTAVILGSRAGTDYLARSAAHAALLLLDTNDLLATPGTEAWLA